MKRPISLLLFFATLFLIRCGGVTPLPSEFTEAVFTPSYASGFEIRGAKGDQSTLVVVRNPWQGAKASEQYLLVLRDGEKAPDNFPGQVVSSPVHHVVCMSSSHVAMFEAIGEIRRVAGVSGIDYISNDYINAHRDCGEVRDVGYDTNLNFELLAAMRPDIVLLYGVSGENAIVTGKLRELGIPYMYIGDYTEESPLGKAEWMIVCAELCDNRNKGLETFGEIADRYNTLKSSVQASSVRPKVMLNTPYRDTWFMPSSQSYMIRLIEDAGGEYIYKDNNTNASIAIDLEEAYLLANDADIWLNTGTCNTLAELTSQNPKFAAIPTIQNHRVYNNNRRQTPFGGSDFWESGVVQPDRVLEDLIGIIRNNSTTSGYYYQRLE